MKWFHKILNNLIKFGKSITDPANDWTPHPDYPWIEINGNLDWRVNTQHPDWWKGVEKHFKVTDTKDEQNV